jgi:O-antigen/teichoic acid export membrane protein
MAFRRLFNDTIIYGTGRVLLQLFAVLLVPVWTRVFSPSDYGIIEVVASGLMAVALFASLGLESASQRSYFDYSEGADRTRVLSTAAIALFTSSLVMSGLVIAFRGDIARELLGNESYSTLVLVAALTIPAGILTNFTQEVMRLRHQPWRYTAISIVTGLGSMAFALVFVLVFDLHLRGYYLGVLVGTTVALVVGWILVRGAIRLILDRRELRVMLAYGLPLVPVAASTWVLQLADRFFLLHYSTLHELGLYGVAYRLANLLLLGSTAFALAWVPLMFEMHAKEPSAERALRARSLNYVTFSLCFGAVFLSAYAREIFQTITSPAFAEAYKAVGLLAGSAVFIGMNSVTISGISIVRRTAYLARYTAYAAVLNIALNFLLIPRLEMVGAALATFVTYAYLAALYYYRSEKLDPAPFEHRRLALILAAATVVIAVGTFVQLDPLWLDALVKIPIVLAYPALLFAVRAFDWKTVLDVRDFALEPFRRRPPVG